MAATIKLDVEDSCNPLIDLRVILFKSSVEMIDNPKRGWAEVIMPRFRDICGNAKSTSGSKMGQQLAFSFYKNGINFED